MWALEVGRRLFGHGFQGSRFPKQSMERVHFEEDGDTVGGEPEQDTQGRGSSHLAAAAAAAAKSLQSCPTLCDRVSPPGSPVPGILQARTLEWVAISFSDA